MIPMGSGFYHPFDHFNVPPSRHSSLLSPLIISISVKTLEPIIALLIIPMSSPQVPLDHPIVPSLVPKVYYSPLVIPVSRKTHEATVALLIIPMSPRCLYGSLSEPIV
ncbi:hypothetical protein CDAR_33281 [Caerostris darwini]|uniref:NADH dehydrogenase subunit 4 n=1 Tax=Caerostris darwini TaxID=1538125 RepID=A0AAV4X2W2_9ARAC|nr:hypothetical protein CDAR_33281 [Caerostris darwini]